MALKKYFALSIIAASVAMSACSSDDDDDTDMTPPVVTPGTTDGMTPGETDGMTPGETDGMTPGETDGMEPEPVTDMSTMTGNSVLDLARGTDDGAGTTTEGVAELASLVRVLGDYPALLNALDDEAVQYTVFAPNNAAIDAAIPEGTPASDDIANTLAFHVVAGTSFNTSAIAADAEFPMMLATAQGSMIEIRFDEENSVYQVVDSAGNVIDLPDAPTATVENGSAVYVIESVLAAPAAMEPGGDTEGTPGGGDDAGDDAGTPAGTAGSGFAAIAGDDSLSSFADLAVASDRFDLSLDSGNMSFVTFAPTDATFAAITPAPTEARNFTVSSIGTVGPLTADQDYMGTSTADTTGITFTVTGTGEGEDLMVNGMPAEYLTTGAEGGTVIKYGS